MSLDRKSLQDREYNKFVESPSRPGEPAIEIVGEITTSPGPFSPPSNADAGTVEYIGNTVVYKFRQGGVAGTVIKTVTLVYTSPQTPDLTEFYL